MRASEVIDATVRLGVRVAGASSGALALIDEDGEQFMLVAAPGARPQVRDEWRAVLRDPQSPVSIAVASRRAVYSRSRAEYVAGHPALEATARALGIEADATLPLVAGNRVLGALSFIFATPRSFDEETERLLGTIAELSAQALERSRLFEAEQAARRALQASEARLRLVLDAARLGTWQWNLECDEHGTPRRHGELAWDARTRALFGVPPDAQIDYRRWAGMVVDTDLPAVEAAVARALDPADPHDEIACDYRVRLAGGELRWLSVSGRAQFEPDPAVQAARRAVGILGTVSDVTAERVAAAALERSTQEARIAAERVQLALAAGAIVGTWDWDVPADRFAVDERFAESFGIDPAIGRTGLSLAQVIATVHPDDVDGLRAAIDEVFARGGAYSHEYRVRGLDGVYRWIEANGRVDLDEHGRPLRFPGVLLDIEARRRMESERDTASALLRAFVDAVPGVVYAKDRAGRLLVANAGTAQLIGKPLEAVLGKTDAEFLDDPVQAAAVMENDRRIMAGGGVEQLEETVSFPDGRRAVWLSTKAPFHDASGRIIGLVGASLDITARKNAEDELREADRRKDEFLAMLSHELRNPLAPVVTAVRLLTREPSLSANGARALEMIARQSRLLTRLVDDLLEVSRITHGHVNLKPVRCALDDLVRHAVEAVRSDADAKRLALRVSLPETPVECVVDDVRIGQVIGNLIGNAMKFTPAGGSVTVELRNAPAGAELIVRDDGIGIAPESLARVFDFFVQVEPRVGAYQGGLGIGLALVKRLVEMHGGSVRAESAGRGTGAQFVVTLPVNGELPEAGG